MKSNFSKCDNFQSIATLVPLSEINKFESFKWGIIPDQKDQQVESKRTSTCHVVLVSTGFDNVTFEIKKIAVWNPPAKHYSQFGLIKP